MIKVLKDIFINEIVPIRTGRDIINYSIFSNHAIKKSNRWQIRANIALHSTIFLVRVTIDILPIYFYFTPLNLLLEN